MSELLTDTIYLGLAPDGRCAVGVTSSGERKQAELEEQLGEPLDAFWSWYARTPANAAEMVERIRQRFAWLRAEGNSFLLGEEVYCQCCTWLNARLCSDETRWAKSLNRRKRKRPDPWR